MDQKAETEVIILYLITISFFATRIMITSLSSGFKTTILVYITDRMQNQYFSSWNSFSVFFQYPQPFPIVLPEDLLYFIKLIFLM